MNHATIDDLYDAITQQLAKPGYKKRYIDEDHFEDDVWKRLWRMFEAKAPSSICLTSHTRRKGRSPEEWAKFCQADSGADVEALGSNNRLDIIVRDGSRTIGIEVKCLGDAGHTAKLTQGLGQAILALAHRDRTIMMIHCGTRPDTERKALREIARKITTGSGTSIIVVARSLRLSPEPGVITVVTTSTECDEMPTTDVTRRAARMARLAEAGTHREFHRRESRRAKAAPAPASQGQR